jgi:hypothetical protein
MADTLPFSTRFFLAWAVFFRVLFDGIFARKVERLGQGDKTIISEDRDIAVEPKSKPPEAEPPPPPPAAPAVDEAQVHQDGAVLLLSLLQQNGRLVDFLRQEIATFDDADVGAAARVVHEGCRKALVAHITIAALRTEDEGTKVKVDADETRSQVKLTGDVRGSAPYEGTLRHKGWRATKVTLPSPTKGHDATLVCPAEVEL